MNADIAKADATGRWQDWWRDGWKRFVQNRLSIFGLVVVFVVVVAAVAAPLLAPSGPFELGGARLAPPQAAHPFGTDPLGRDVLSGVLYGARTSLQVGLLSMILSVTLGIVVGAVSGYYGRWLDDLLMRITEVFQVMPRFFLALGRRLGLGERSSQVIDEMHAQTSGVIDAVQRDLPRGFPQPLLERICAGLMRQSKKLVETN